jgi:hypothetical protein
MVLVMLNDLIDFLAILGIILFGFTVSMHAMFREMHGYHSIIETFLTLFLAALGEFDFDALQISAEHGKYDTTFIFGSVLLLVYLLLATVLLLNLVVAKFSSTYMRIEATSYEKWCLLFAQVVEDYHQSKEKKAKQSSLCAVPPPLNIFTALAGVLQYQQPSIPFVKYTANAIFALFVNYPCCIALHCVTPVVSVMHLLPLALSGGFVSFAEFAAAATFVANQALMIPFCPLTSWYYMVGGGTRAADAHLEIARKQEEYAKARFGFVPAHGSLHKKALAEYDEDDDPSSKMYTHRQPNPAHYEMRRMSTGMPAHRLVAVPISAHDQMEGAAKGMGDQQSRVDELAAATAAAAAADAESGAEKVSSAGAAGGKRANEAVLREKGVVDALFARLFSRRHALLVALEKEDLRNCAAMAAAAAAKKEDRKATATPGTANAGGAAGGASTPAAKTRPRASSRARSGGAGGGSGGGDGGVAAAATGIVTFVEWWNVVRQLGGGGTKSKDGAIVSPGSPNSPGAGTESESKLRWKKVRDAVSMARLFNKKPPDKGSKEEEEDQENDGSSESSSSSADEMDCSSKEGEGGGLKKGLKKQKKSKKHRGGGLTAGFAAAFDAVAKQAPIMSRSFISRTEARRAFQIIHGSQIQSKTEKARGALLQPGTIDYKQLKTDMRPFAPRIPVRLKRSAHPLFRFVLRSQVYPTVQFSCILSL